MRRHLAWTVLLALAVVGGIVYGCSERAAGARDAKDVAEREHAKEIVDSNRVWLDYVDRVIDSVKADTMRAAEAKARADVRRANRPAISGATDWKARAEDLEAENMDLREAFAAQAVATALLLPVAEADTAKLAETTLELDKSLDREADKGKFTVDLGLFDFKVPKPPKWLAGTLGCAAGGLLGSAVPARPEDRARNLALGCTTGAAALTIVVPTD